jgi:hypothetical protein
MKMTEVLQLEKLKKESDLAEKDTWILELPAEVCQREGYAEGTMVSLTVKDGGIQTSIIQPSAEIDDFVSRVVEEEREFFGEMKRIGD